MLLSQKEKASADEWMIPFASALGLLSFSWDGMPIHSPRPSLVLSFSSNGTLHYGSDHRPVFSNEKLYHGSDHHHNHRPLHHFLRAGAFRFFEREAPPRFRSS